MVYPETLKKVEQKKLNVRKIPKTLCLQQVQGLMSAAMTSSKL